MQAPFWETETDAASEDVALTWILQEGTGKWLKNVTFAKKNVTLNALLLTRKAVTEIMCRHSNSVMYITQITKVMYNRHNRFVQI